MYQFRPRIIYSEGDRPSRTTLEEVDLEALWRRHKQDPCEVQILVAGSTVTSPDMVAANPCSSEKLASWRI